MTKNLADITEFVERMKRLDPTLTPEQHVAVLGGAKASATAKTFFGQATGCASSPSKETMACRDGLRCMYK
jgi:hypothetical protein